MRKLGLLLILITLFGMLYLVIEQSRGYAADAYLIRSAQYGDSAFILKNEQPWRFLYIDTFTLHLRSPDSTINLGFYGYNPSMRSLNIPGNSTFVKIAFDSHKSFFRDDSVARNYDWSKVGEASGNDYLLAPIEFKKIYARVTKGDSGTDSTVTIELKFVR